MDNGRPTDNEQATLWNGPAGRAWVEAQESLDRMLKPFEDLLVEAVSLGHGLERRATAPASTFRNR
jgi:hypothetical protein